MQLRKAGKSVRIATSVGINLENSVKVQITKASLELEGSQDLGSESISDPM